MLAIHKSLDTIDTIHDKTFYGLRTENASDLQLNQCTKVTPRPPLQNVPI